MTKDSASYLLSELMNVAFLICGPILLVALAVGLLISIIQVVTQIQEMTLTFVPKMIAVAMVVMFLSNWMLSVLMDFSISLFDFAASL